MSFSRAAWSARAAEEAEMTGISQATIRQFLRTAAVALALGNEAAQAAGAGEAEALMSATDKKASTPALAQQAGSGRQLSIPPGNEAQPIRRQGSRPSAGPPGGNPEA